METTLRSFRILFPPATLVGHILLAKFLNNTLLPDIACLAEKEILTVVAGIVAAAMIPLGFAIGGFTAAICWVVFDLRGTSYQLLADIETVEKIWKTRKFPGKATTENALYGRFAFTDFLEKRTQDHLDRLWEAASGYSAALVALVLAAGLLLWQGEELTCGWWTTSAALLVVFLFIVRRNRIEISRIIKFQVEVELAKVEKGLDEGRAGC